jgi:HK97 family phage major capsid protein
MFDFQGANVLHITAWDSENQTAGPFGGVSAQWVAEGGTFTAVDPNIRAMILKAAKLGIYVDVTREASQNATALVQELGQQMTRACVYEVDRCIMNGTGIGQPLGVLNAGSAIDVTRAGAGAIDYADITGMYRRLYPGFLKGAAWFASPDAIEQLLTLQDPASQYIWVPSVDGVANSRPGFLLGLPLYLTDKCPALGTRGDLVLADLGAYAVAVAQEVRLEKTDSARWYNDIYSFRAIMRMDGQALMDNEITPRNGGTSLSWAVVLN